MKILKQKEPLSCSSDVCLVNVKKYDIRTQKSDNNIINNRGNDNNVTVATSYKEGH